MVRIKCVLFYWYGPMRGGGWESGMVKCLIHTMKCLLTLHSF